MEGVEKRNLPPPSFYAIIRRAQTMEKTTITYSPIGMIHNGIDEAHHDTPWPDIESAIVLDPEWEPALEGLEQFSHIWVIFHFHKSTEPDSPRVHPMRRPDLPLVGRFATRSPQRPNGIGICAVELLEIQGATLRVRGLEALDGTPVLDIKPYMARGDAIENTRVGEWVRDLWETEWK